jgi:ATP-dependent helicase/DNAse subunit B
MSARVTLLTGPAGAGKTARLLARYRAALGSSPPGQTLWIAPTRRSAAWVRAQLLNDELPACFDPNVFTFSGFAERIVEANGARVVPLSSTMKRVLIRRVVRELHAAGRLEYFAPVAEKPGFVETLAALISELKRAETWPEDFRRATGKRGQRQKDGELADLYQAYQERLVKLGRYDAEGRFWSARDLLGKGRRRPFEGVRLVVVDGFTDFTHTQYDILEKLAAAAEETWISLPLESPLRRRELFAKSSETLERLQARWAKADVRVEALASSPAKMSAALARLERCLFLVSKQDATPAVAESVEVFEAVGQLGEVRLIAARVKQLLLDGVAADDVAVVFRDLDAYAPLVDEVFAQLGVPLALEVGTPLSRVPAMSVLVGLVRLVAEDWPFSQLTALLRSNFLQPDWPEWGDDSRRAAESALRRLRVPSGRAHYFREIERELAREAGRTAVSEADEADAEVRRSEAETALALLRRFADALDRLPASRSPLSAWVDGLRRMAEALGFPKALQASPGSSATEGRVWQTLSDALDHWVFAESALEDSPAKIDRRQFASGLRELLAWEQLPPAGDAIGRVRVWSASQCRAVPVPYLFVGGMSEKSFPSPHHADALYSESERRKLNRHGLSLGHRRSAFEEEMLLFYQVVTRAERRLVFSYPATDSQGEPLLASEFLEDALSAFDPECVRRSTPDQLDPVPADDAVYSVAAARVRAVDDALAGRVEGLSRLQAHEPLAAVCDNLLAALTTTHARRQVQAFGPFEGVLLGDKARRQIARRFGRTYSFSATELETYAVCPFRYFLSTLIGAAELQDPDATDDLAARGSLAHRTLAGLHRILNQHASAPCSPGDLPEETFREHLQTAIERAMGSIAGTDVRRALAEIEQLLLGEWGEKYLEQHRQYEEQLAAEDCTLRPAHFEVAFGMPPRRRRDADPLSTAEPYVLGTGEEEVRLCGQIDRIDVGRLEGRVVFNVIDYKTGSSAHRTKKQMGSGTALQLPLYTLATQHLLLEQSEAVPRAGGYWFLAENGFKAVLEMTEPAGGARKETDDWAAVRRQVEDVVVALARGVRAAEFPVFSADDHCTSHCPYHTVCRVHQVRALNKTWESPRDATKS